jgi:hypothetical protein
LEKTMGWRLASTCVIVAMPVVVLAYDFVAYRAAGSDGTISRVALATSEARPWFLVAVCFLLALLCGHLFVPTTSEPSWVEWLHVIAIVAVPLFSALHDLLATATGAEAEPKALVFLGDFIRDHRML